METYIHRSGEQLGPYTEAELMQMLTDGNILPEDQLWDQGQRQWKNAQIHLRTQKSKARPLRPKEKQKPYLLIAVCAVALLFVVIAVQFKEVAGAGFFVLFSMAFGFLVYFLPSIIAVKRGHRNALALILLNVFLGWTLVGWVVALVWSVYQENNK